jgi:hypothetical protein
MWIAQTIGPAAIKDVRIWHQHQARTDHDQPQCSAQLVTRSQSADEACEESGAERLFRAYDAAEHGACARAFPIYWPRQ